jgi:GNAT superfamily N-acetyltransferase
VGARPATSADLARLGELCRLARSELAGMRGGWIWSRRDARPDPVEVSLAGALAAPDHCVVAGTVDGYVAGYGVARLEELRDGSLLGVVEDLYTEPLFRAVGVGEAVMDELVEYCRARGCVGVDSFALPGDRETKNFFESFGLKARGLLVHRSLRSVVPVVGDDEGGDA